MNQSGAPEYVSDFYLSLLLDSLKADDISIFAIIGEVRDNPGDLGNSAGGLGGKWVTVYPRGGAGAGGARGGAGGRVANDMDDQVQDAIALSLAQEEDDAMAAAIAASLAEGKNNAVAAPLRPPPPPPATAAVSVEDEDEAKALAMSRALSAPEGDFALHVQLGDHGDLSRTFAGDTALDIVYDWIYGLTGKKGGTLVTPFPKKEFPKSAALLKDAGFDGKRIKLIYRQEV